MEKYVPLYLDIFSLKDCFPVSVAENPGVSASKVTARVMLDVPSQVDFQEEVQCEKVSSKTSWRGYRVDRKGQMTLWPLVPDLAVQGRGGNSRSYPQNVLKGLERLPVSKRFLSCDYTEG
jgi:hypothetical protein